MALSRASSQATRLTSRGMPSCSSLPSRSLQGFYPKMNSTDFSSHVQPNAPNPPTVVVHGISATCKSTIVRGVLSSLKVPHAIVRSTECITGRHLLTKILWGALEALGQQSEWERYGKGRCENVSGLAVLLGQCLTSRSSSGAEKFVLVLDGIDKQREAPQTLLAALARLGEIVSITRTPAPVWRWENH